MLQHYISDCVLIYCILQIYTLWRKKNLHELQLDGVSSDSVLARY